MEFLAGDPLIYDSKRVDIHMVSLEFWMTSKLYFALLIGYSVALLLFVPINWICPCIQEPFELKRVFIPINQATKVMMKHVDALFFFPFLPLPLGGG